MHTAFFKYAVGRSEQHEHKGARDRHMELCPVQVWTIRKRLNSKQHWLGIINMIPDVLSARLMICRNNYKQVGGVLEMHRLAPVLLQLGDVTVMKSLKKL